MLSDAYYLDLDGIENWEKWRLKNRIDSVRASVKIDSMVELKNLAREVSWLPESYLECDCDW